MILAVINKTAKQNKGLGAEEVTKKGVYKGERTSARLLKDDWNWWRKRKEYRGKPLLKAKPPKNIKNWWQKNLWLGILLEREAKSINFLSFKNA